MPKAVVVKGNLSDGFILVGDFRTWDNAAVWDTTHLNQGPPGSWVAMMFSPEEFAREMGEEPDKEPDD